MNSQFRYLKNESELLNFAIEARFNLNDFDCVLIDDISHFIINANEFVSFLTLLESVISRDKTEFVKMLYRLLAYLHEMQNTIKSHWSHFLTQQ